MVILNKLKLRLPDIYSNMLKIKIKYISLNFSNVHTHNNTKKRNFNNAI